MSTPAEVQDRRFIGQHFVLGFHGLEPDNHVKELIQKYYVGNIILMKRNVQSIEQVHRLTQSLQQLAKDAKHEKPLLIGIDQENGLVSAFSGTDGKAGTQFPGAMTLSATQEPGVAEQVTFASASEMKLAGINWAFSPVADVNSDARNPVIGVRSFGDDPTSVAQFAAAVARGLQEAGIAACTKHFPGHGDTHVDSHLALPHIAPSANAQAHLIPFNALIKSGIASIMTAHLLVPALGDDQNPASLSRAISHDLMRNKLSFSGVVVTDCLEMDAVRETVGTAKSALRALEAGNDIVMICHTPALQIAALDLAYAALSDRRLDASALLQSTKRIYHLKDAYAGGWDDVFALPYVATAVDTLKLKNNALSAQAYATSTALLRNSKGTIPLRADHSILLLTPQAESLNRAVDDADGLARDAAGRLRNTAGPSYLAFAAAIRVRLKGKAKLEHVVYAPAEEISVDLSTGPHSIIFTTRNAHTSAWQRDALASVRRAVKEDASMVVISTCAPYDVLEDDGLAALATFEFTVPALEAAVAVLLGERSPTGRVPVRGEDSS